MLCIFTRIVLNIAVGPHNVYTLIKYWKRPPFITAVIIIPYLLDTYNLCGNVGVVSVRHREFQKTARKSLKVKSQLANNSATLINTEKVTEKVEHVGNTVLSLQQNKKP